jgi:hypothetical protein
MDVRLIRVFSNGTINVLQEYDNLADGIVSASLLGTPAAGNATYQLQVRMASGVSAGSAFCLNRSLTAQVLKR